MGNIYGHWSRWGQGWGQGQGQDVRSFYQGMGNIYGPPEHELRAAEENPLKRNQIIEDTLLPLFDTMADDFENATDK